jgi:hypothetical protein
VARAKQALASLPWVDHKTVKADVRTKELKFTVPDMTKFNKTQLLDAFKEHEFPKASVVSPKL